GCVRLGAQKPDDGTTEPTSEVFQFGPELSVTDNETRDVGPNGHCPDQELNVLLGGQATHETDDKIGVRQTEMETRSRAANRHRHAVLDCRYTGRRDADGCDQIPSHMFGDGYESHARRDEPAKPRFDDRLPVVRLVVVDRHDHTAASRDAGRQYLHHELQVHVHDAVAAVAEDEDETPPAVERSD